jgi:hypothetical protein
MLLLHKLNVIYKKSQQTVNIDISHLLKDSLNVAKQNASQFVQPYFYTQTIPQIINKIPHYIILLKLAQTISNNDIGNQIQQLLEQWYGKEYSNSSELNTNVTIQISQFEISEFNHYIIIDIDKAIELYNSQKLLVDYILSKTS